MTTTEYWGLIVTVIAGFAWMVRRFDKIDEKFTSISRQLNNIENRLVSIETIFIMMGYPLKKTGTEEKK